MGNHIDAYESISASRPEEFADIRREVEKLLGERIPNQLWVVWVTDNPDPDQMNLGDYVEECKSWMRRQIDALQERRVVKKSIEFQSDDPRYAGLAEILALEAERDPSVVEWRARYLPDGPVENGEIRAAIARLRQLVIPRPAGSAKRNLQYRTENDVRSTTVDLDSPLGELCEIADRLRQGYHWLPTEAVGFVLTEAIPRYFPIMSRLRITDRAATSRITLTVDPRVHPAEVARAYEAARSDPLLAKVASGAPARRLSPRAPKLAGFVASNLGSPWRAMLVDWNQRYPEWKYKSERAFSSDARRAWRRVVGAELRADEAEDRVRDLAASALSGVPPGTIPRGD